MESAIDVPIIDAETFLNKQEDEKYLEECKKCAESLHKYGIIVLKDPRVNEQQNEDYIDLMEQYFEQAGKEFYDGKELKDAHPEVHYQTGVTPEKVEKAKNHC
jgi:hypothetical protein